MPFRTSQRLPQLLRCGFLLLATFHLTSLSLVFAQATQSTTNAAADQSLTLKLSGPEGISSLKGCEVRFQGRIAGDRIDQRLRISDQGTARLAYPSGQVNFLSMSIRHPEFVPVYYSWRSDNSEIKLPEQVDVQLERGKELSGLVKDEQGSPIPDAKVSLSMPITWPKLDSFYFTLATLTTDAEGRWSYPNAPQLSHRVSIRATHPDFIDGSTSADGNPSLVLKQGISFPGSVVDPMGRPVQGAIARLGADRWGTKKPEAHSDEDGKFTLKNCEPGANIITVQAPGYSPQIQDVTVRSKNNAEIKFQLRPPHDLKIRVVDIDGTSVPRATVVVDGWQGYRTLEFRGLTNNRGEVTWDSAPSDAIICDILKQGYMAARDSACIPGEKFNVITLHPELVISGRVVDAEAEELIPEFRIIRGQNQTNLRRTYWRTDEDHTYKNGRFTFKFDDPMQSWQLQVIAEGYKPKVSREFKSTEGNVRYHFLLEKAPTLTGQVVDAEGQPVENAQVLVATSEKNAEFVNGVFQERLSSTKATLSQADGSYSVTLPEDEFFLLIAVHETGFVELAQPDVAEEDQLLQLQPWGQLAGEVKLAERPDPQRELSYFAERPRDGRSYRTVDYRYQTNSNDQGAFEFNRVIPGPGILSRVTVVNYGTGVQHSTGWQTPVAVEPGQRQSLQLGGTGSTVRGKISLDRQPPADTNWQFEPSLALVALDRESGQRLDPYRRYVGEVLSDGSFTIPDVPAGVYQISTKVNAISPQNQIAGSLGQLTTTVTVPDQPTQLDELVIPLDRTLEIGDTMPAFVAESLEGRVLDSRKIRGMLVFINFWSTYTDASLGETAQLGSIIEDIDSDRALFLSLATEERIEAAWEEVRERGWQPQSARWVHAYAGPRRAKSCKSFYLKSLPANFIFGPDGRLLAKNIPPQDIRATFVKLLNEVDFAVEAVEEQSRFPIAHFPLPEDADSQAKPRPAVLLVDDAAQNTTETDSKQDHLIAFDAALNELWRYDEVKNYGSGSHKIVPDTARERIYLCEDAGQRVTALDFQGNKLWQVSDIDASCATLDPQTGNIWISGGSLMTFGETVVLSPEGKELLALPYRAVDLLYHPAQETFWLVGKHLLIVDRSGNVQLRQPASDHIFQSISLQPATSEVWATERDHPDVAGSKNRLWIFSPQGKVQAELDLGQLDPFSIQCTATDEAVIGGFRGGLQRVFRNGETQAILERVPQTEPRAKEQDPENGEGNGAGELQILSLAASADKQTLWVVTREKVATGEQLVKLKNGRIVARTSLVNANLASLTAL